MMEELTTESEIARTGTDHWTDAFLQYDPCVEGVRDAMKYATPTEWWDSCQRGDYMLWVWALETEPWSDDRRPIVAAAVECAELVKNLWRAKNRDRLVSALEYARAFARGEDVDRDEYRAAAYAAYAATAYVAAEAAAYDAAHAAAEAAGSAAEAAGSAADAAAEAAAYDADYAAFSAAEAAASDVADIVRRHCPQFPKIEMVNKPRETGLEK